MPNGVDFTETWPFLNGFVGSLIWGIRQTGQRNDAGIELVSVPTNLLGAPGKSLGLKLRDPRNIRARARFSVRLRFSGRVTVSREKTMDSIIYLVGLVVVVLFILSMLGLR